MEEKEIFPKRVHIVVEQELEIEYLGTISMQELDSIVSQLSSKLRIEVTEILLRDLVIDERTL